VIAIGDDNEMTIFQKADLMSAPPIRIVVVDDSPLYRETICSMLEKQPNLQVVAEAGDGAYAIQAVEKHRPDVVLMDITLPVLDGFKAIRIIRSKFPDTRIIVLTMHTDESFSDTALHAGACRFLTKDCGKEKLIKAIEECSPGPSRVVGNLPH
jgi:two-component system, NarL family, nitrate/nitrite response regulator NarL